MHNNSSADTARRRGLIQALGALGDLWRSICLTCGELARPTARASDSHPTAVGIVVALGVTT